MNNELKELLSKEKANVLKTKKERMLPEEKKKNLAEDRRINLILDRAEANEKELLALIAKGFLNVYGDNKERMLYEDKSSRYTETSVGVKNIYIIEPDVTPKDKYFEKACVRGKRRKNQTDKPLYIWRNRTIDRYGNNSVELVYLNKQFLNEQNIEVKHIQKGYMCFRTDEESLNKFVNKLLNNEFDEIKIDNFFIKEFDERLKKIDVVNACLSSLKRNFQTNAKIIALDICKKAIELYNNIELVDNEKNKTFTANVYAERWQVEDLFEKEKWSIISKYNYDEDIIGVEHGEKYLPTFVKYLNNALREIGIKYDIDSNGEFIVNILKFEEAVLNASKSSKRKTGRKV